MSLFYKMIAICAQSLSKDKSVEESLRKEINNLRDMNGRLQDRIAAQEKEIEEHCTEIVGYEEMFEKFQIKHSKEIDKLEDINEKLNISIMSRQFEIDELNKQIENVLNENFKHQADIDELLDSHALATRKLSQLHKIARVYHNSINFDHQVQGKWLMDMLEEASKRAKESK